MEIHKSIGNTCRWSGNSIEDALKNWLNIQHTQSLKALLLMVVWGVSTEKNHALSEGKFTSSQLFIS